MLNVLGSGLRFKPLFMILFEPLVGTTVYNKDTNYPARTRVIKIGPTNKKKGNIKKKTHFLGQFSSQFSFLRLYTRGTRH